MDAISSNVDEASKNATPNEYTPVNSIINRIQFSSLIAFIVYKFSAMYPNRTSINKPLHSIKKGTRLCPLSVFVCVCVCVQLLLCSRFALTCCLNFRFLNIRHFSFFSVFTHSSQCLKSYIFAV